MAEGKENVLDAILRFTIDQARLKGVGGVVAVAIGGAVAGVRKLEEGINKAADSLKDFGSSARNIQRDLEDAISPLTQAGSKFRDMAGAFDPVAQKWSEASYKMEQSQMKIGRTMSSAMLPYMDKASEMLSDADKFIQANPQVVQGAAALAGAAGLAGVLGQVALSLGAVVKVAGSLIMGMGALAKAMVTTNLGAGATAGVAVVAATAETKNFIDNIGQQVNWLQENMIKDSKDIDEYNAKYEELKKKNFMIAGAIGMQGWSVKSQQELEIAKAAITAKGGPEDKGSGKSLVEQAFDAISEQVSGLVDAISKPVAGSPTGTATVSAEDSPYLARAAEMWVDYQKDIAMEQTRYQQDLMRSQVQFDNQVIDNDRRYEQEKLRTALDYQRQLTDAAEEFNKQNAQLFKEYQKDDLKAEEDFYAQREESAAQYGEEVAQMEKDHAKEMRRMREDQVDSETEMAGQRDALGLVRAIRQNQKDRERAEEDYNEQLSDRNSQAAKDIADQSAQFQAERDQRLADYQLRLEENQTQYDERLKEMQKQNKRQLEDMQTQHNLEEAEQKLQYQRELSMMETQFNLQSQMRATQFNDQITQLDAHLTGMNDEWLAWQSDQVDNLNVWLKDMSDGFSSFFPGFGGGASAGGNTSNVNQTFNVGALGAAGQQMFGSLVRNSVEQVIGEAFAGSGEGMMAE